MNVDRPLTYALPINPRPGRTMVVSDPRKLSYFAQANLTRMGLNKTAGTLRGLGSLGQERSEYVTAPTADEGNWQSTMYQPGGGPTVANKPPEPTWYEKLGAAAGSFANNIFAQRGPVQTMPAQTMPLQQYQPQKDNTILGLPPAVAVIGGVALVGGLGYMLMKKGK